MYNGVQQLYAHHTNVRNPRLPPPGIEQLPECISRPIRQRWSCYLTIILEVVVSHDLCTWHAFFGFVGSLNDINVLNMSSIFDDMYNEIAPDDRKRLKFKIAQRRRWKMLNEFLTLLKKRCHILKYLETFVEESKMNEVMYTCITLHNMILEDEWNAICKYSENEIVPPTQTFKVGSEEYLTRRWVIHDVEIHHDLCIDLKEYIWTVDHIDLNA